jgi:hypothetical protein
MIFAATVAGLFAPLLAADVELWLKLTFAAVAGLIWLVNQIFKEARKPGQAPRPPAPPQQQRPQPGLEDVQEFLRRAAEQRQRDAQPQRPKQKPPKLPKKPQQQQPRKPKTIARPLQSEAIDEPMRERSVGEHVKKHLDPQVFKERSRHLSSVAEAPSQIASHTQQVFDHQVGRLARGTESDDDPATEGPRLAPTPAAAIAAMLANPDSLRQAFILGEIFRRPDETR